MEHLLCPGVTQALPLDSHANSRSSCDDYTPGEKALENQRGIRALGSHT